MRRRNVEEQMDRPDLHSDGLEGDLRNLEVLNRLFGGRSVVRRHVGALLPRVSGNRLRVLDIGSGAGDLCRELIRLCRRAGVAVEVTSVDFHSPIQEYARHRLGREYPEAWFVRGDARRLPFRSASFDLVLCTLALHHFEEEDAVAVLREMRRVTRRWALVSDLARSEIGYAAVWFATRFTRNPMTRFDGPASVQRAFTPGELRNLASRAGWEGAKLTQEPWFRMSLLGEWETA